MCTVLLPTGGYPLAVNKYIIYHITSYHIIYHKRCGQNLVVAYFETIHGIDMEGSTYQSWRDIYIGFIKKINQTDNRIVNKK